MYRSTADQNGSLPVKEAPPHVGFYIHYHGRGHKHRAESTIEHLNLPVTIFTSHMEDEPFDVDPSRCNVVHLASDIEDVPDVGLSRSQDLRSLHHVPLWTSGCTRRIAQLSQWMDEVRPALMVVDVSAEVSMLSRLAAIPQLVVRQHGDRSDVAHCEVYRAAEALLAPFPELMKDPDVTPDWVREKTVYLGGFVRPMEELNQSDARSELAISDDEQIVTVMFGRGGDDDRVKEIIAAARTLDEYQWLIVGKEKPTTSESLPENLTYVGWTDRVVPYIAAANIVVSAAGHNSVMELGQRRKRFIAIAEPRPFDEQLRKVSVLNREGLAIGLDEWPESPQLWRSLFAQCQRLDLARWDEVFDTDGAAKAADVIEKAAYDSYAITNPTHSDRQHAN